MRRRPALAVLGAALALSCAGGSVASSPARRADDVSRRVVLDPVQLAPDLVALRRGGVLRVALPAEPSSYALVRGRVTGLEYEVFEALSSRLGVDLEVVVLDSAVERLQALSEGRVHATAGALPADPGRAGVRWSASLVPERHIAVAADAPGLHGWIDGWIAQEPARLTRLGRRYLRPTAAIRLATTRQTGRLSPFDDLLRRAGRSSGLDWRLLAALAFQESGWRSFARSRAGAVGLMQLMPATARQVHVHDRLDPAQSIEGGARYLVWLDRLWRARVPEDEARLPLVLASYNAGAGHVADARRLAAVAGEDPDDWEVVSHWLLALEEPRWAAHPVVRHGRCFGPEPVHYVAAVLDRFGHYSALIPDDGVADASSELSSDGEPGPASSSPASIGEAPGGSAG